MNESKSISAILLQIQSHAVDREQHDMKEQRNIRKQKQLLDVKGKFKDFRKIDNKFYDKLGQEIYVCNISGITIQVVLHWDFPDREAKCYVNEQLTNKSIDPQTWEITLKNNSLVLKLEGIQRLFDQNKPEKDILIYNDEETFHQEIIIKNEIESIKKSEFKNLFKQMNPSQIKNVKLTFLEELLQDQENYQKVVEIITQKAKQNKMLEEQIIEIEKENKQLINIMNNQIELFETLEIKYGDLQQACQTIKKKFQIKELLSQLRKKIQKLEDRANELYENKQNDMDKANFEKMVQEFQKNRGQHWLCEAKKNLFVDQYVNK